MPGTDAGQGLKDAKGIDGYPLWWREIGQRDCSSPKVKSDRNGGSAHRRFKVRWQDRYLADAAIQGYSLRVADPTPRISRYLPEYIPDRPHLVAVATDITPVATTGLNESFDDVYYPALKNKQNQFQYAFIDVEYDAVKYDVLTNTATVLETDRYFTYDRREAAEYLSLPTGSILWPSTHPFPGSPCPINIGKVVCPVEHKFEWLQVPYTSLDQDYHRECQGCVNKTAWRNFPPGTALLLASQPVRSRQPTGAWAWDVQMTVKYDFFEHNQFFDWSNGLYWLPSRSGTAYVSGAIPDGEAVFNEREFADLFVSL